MRTGAETEIELPVTMTPLGAIARLEHALAGFEDEQEHYRRRLADAERRLASYRARAAKPSPSRPNSMKRAQLAEIEADLANDGDSAGNAELADDSRAAA